MLSTQIALLEDDQELSELLCDFLASHSMEVIGYATPRAFLEGVKNHSFDLAIIDLTLPQMDGLEVCKILRETSSLPFIISSARSDLSDKLIGLERGADDYLPKPYDPRELIARIQNILRRCKHSQLVSSANTKLKIDEQKMSVHINGNMLDLTLAEYEILKLLVDKKGSVLSRDYIAENTTSMRWESSERSIDVVISRLRKKLGDNPRAPEFIKSIKGAGYKYIG